MPTYAIIRSYMRPENPAETIKTEQTLKEARDHCRSPEASSRTCSSGEGLTRTANLGPWFDGYTKE